jgi:hypothetical protein
MKGMNPPLYISFFLVVECIAKDVVFFSLFYLSFCYIFGEILITS